MRQTKIEEYNIKKTIKGTSMPDNMKLQVEDVLAGISALAGRTRKKSFSFPKVAAVAAAAVLLIGGSVFAATQLLNFNIEQKSAYSVEVGVNSDTASDASDRLEENSAFTAPAEVAAVEIDLAYMTPGVKDVHKGGYTFSNEDSDFGYFIFDLYTDTAGAFTQDFVTDYETLEIDGRPAAFLCTQGAGSDPDWLQQYLYVSFPEFDRVVVVQGWGHAEREEIIKIAEGISLKDTGEKIAFEKQATLSNYMAYMNGELQDEGMVIDEYHPVQSVGAEEMKNLHKIGEEFIPYAYEGTPQYAADITIDVSDVQIADDLSLLEASAEIPESWTALVSEDGSLQNGVVQFVKQGDGKDSLNEIVATQEFPVKLVYVTVEYHNNSDTDLNNLGYMARLVGIDETDGQYHIIQDIPGGTEDVEYDSMLKDPMIGFGEMYYYDVHGGERNNNYISEIKAGESAVVHMAWIVPEQDLDKMFLNLSGDANWDGFSEGMLATGLVDLRQ